MTETPSFSTSRKPNGARTRRYILAVIIFLALALIATHTFLHRTSVGGKNFVQMTFTIYTLTALIVLALLILATILGRNLIKLYFERKSGQLGSGFKAKMVRTFIALSLLPALLLFILAYSLISSSIEKWFGAPPAQMMENSRLLANQYYAEAEARAKYYAREIAGSFSFAEAMLPGPHTGLHQKLQEYCRHYDLDSVRVYDNHGRLVLESGTVKASKIHQSILKDLVIGQPPREAGVPRGTHCAPRPSQRDQLGNGPDSRSGRRCHWSSPDRVRPSAERQVPGRFGHGGL